MLRDPHPHAIVQAGAAIGRRWVGTYPFRIAIWPRDWKRGRAHPCGLLQTEQIHVTLHVSLPALCPRMRCFFTDWITKEAPSH